MISSLRITGKYNIGVSANDTIMMGDNEVSLKDIPIVRFKLGSYGAEEVEYIRSTLSKFRYSSGIIEVNDDARLFEMEYVSSLKDIAGILYYVSVTDEIYRSNMFNASDKLLRAIKEDNFEKVILVDNTTCLDIIGADALIKRVAKALGIGTDRIGMCESPMCLAAGVCCISAVDARDIASKYNFNTEVAIHSANHQSMDTCSCVRHFTVKGDIEAPIKLVTKKSRSSSSNGKTKSTKVYSYRSLI